MVNDYDEDLKLGGQNFLKFNMLAKEDVQNQRYFICKSCDKFNNKVKICKECGCFMPFKVKIDSTKCPQNKW
jgi:hypothetical protein